MTFETISAGSHGPYVCCLRALLTLGNLKLDLLAVAEFSVPLTSDGGVMHEDILSSAILLDEAESFVGVEPLDSAGCHTNLLTVGTTGRRRDPSRRQPLVITVSSPAERP